MPSNAEREHFEGIIQECLSKLHPTRDNDMYIFYLGFCSIKKAVNEADASIILDLLDEEVKKLSYRGKVDCKLKMIEDLFQDYVCEMKGFEHVSYFHNWMHEMEQISKSRTDWTDRIRLCALRLRPFVFA